jgi:hypothetical protein
MNRTHYPFLFTGIMLLMFFLPFTGHAQFEKGHKIIGGNFSISYQNNQTGDFFSKHASVGVSPSMGYFLNEKSLIGFSPVLFYGYHSNSYNEGNQDHRWGYGGSLFYRRFFKASEQFHFFLEPQLGFTHRRGEPSTIDFQAMLSPGLALILSDRFWLEAKFGGLGYSYYQANNESETNSSSRFFTGLYSFSSIGLFYILK